MAHVERLAQAAQKRLGAGGTGGGAAEVNYVAVSTRCR
jgi:hypothetical protein